MNNTVRMAEANTNPILCTDKQVLVDDIHRNIKPGFRQVLARDISFRFYHDCDFRKEFLKTGEIWTADRGVSRIGPYRILENGTFPDVKEGSIGDLPEGQQSFHYNGIGQTVLSCGYYKGKIALYVNGEYRPSRTAKVAYIRNEKPQEITTNNDTVTIPVVEINAAKEALRNMKESLDRMPHTANFYNSLLQIEKLLRDRT